MSITIAFLIGGAQIAAAAFLGSLLGDRIRAHDDRRREARDATDALIDSTRDDRIREYARRKVWAA